MLTASILPSPNIEPAAAVAWYLTNPLLLGAYPEGIARRAKQVADGEYTGKALHTLAVSLYTERNRLRLAGPVEPEQATEYADLLGLLQSRHLTADEKKDLGYRIRTARPSEYAWLRTPIAATIQTRGETAMLEAAAKVSRATNTKIMRASELATAA